MQICRVLNNRFPKVSKLDIASYNVVSIRTPFFLSFSYSTNFIPLDYTCFQKSIESETSNAMNYIQRFNTFNLHDNYHIASKILQNESTIF